MPTAIPASVCSFCHENTFANLNLNLKIPYVHGSQLEADCLGPNRVFLDAHRSSTPRGQAEAVKQFLIHPFGCVPFCGCASFCCWEFWHFGEPQGSDHAIQMQPPTCRHPHCGGVWILSSSSAFFLIFTLYNASISVCTFKQ